MVNKDVYKIDKKTKRQVWTGKLFLLFIYNPPVMVNKNFHYSLTFSELCGINRAKSNAVKRHLQQQKRVSTSD